MSSTEPRTSGHRRSGHESHADLPKTFILTAEHDPLLDNGAHYRDALVAAGVPVRYAEYEGAIHGFMSLPGVVPAAKQALDDIVDFLAPNIVTVSLSRSR